MVSFQGLGSGEIRPCRVWGFEEGDAGVARSGTQGSLVVVQGCGVVAHMLDGLICEDDFVSVDSTGDTGGDEGSHKQVEDPLSVHEEGMDQVGVGAGLGFKCSSSLGGLVQSDALQEDVVEGAFFRFFDGKDDEEEEVAQRGGQVCWLSHVAAGVKLAGFMLVFLDVGFVKGVHCRLLGGLKEGLPEGSFFVGLAIAENGQFLIQQGVVGEVMSVPTKNAPLGAECFGHDEGIEVDTIVPTTLVDQAFLEGVNAVFEKVCAWGLLFFEQNIFKVLRKDGGLEYAGALVAGFGVAEQGSVFEHDGGCARAFGGGSFWLGSSGCSSGGRDDRGPGLHVFGGLERGWSSGRWVEGVRGG